MNIGCINQQPSFKGAIITHRNTRQCTTLDLLSNVPELQTSSAHNIEVNSVEGSGRDCFVFKGDTDEDVVVKKLNRQPGVTVDQHIRDPKELEGKLDRECGGFKSFLIRSFLSFKKD
jgi:hypothetical protein